jgi:hypothetical protein
MKIELPVFNGAKSSSGVIASRQHGGPILPAVIAHAGEQATMAQSGHNTGSIIRRSILDQNCRDRTRSADGRRTGNDARS